MRNGAAKNGLGVVYHTVTEGGNPPNTSRLAAVLEECQIFISVDTTERGKHWRLNPGLNELIENSSVADLKEFIWKSIGE